MFRRLLAPLAITLGLAAALPAAADTSERHPHSPPGGWSFDGPFGTFNQAQLQRGYRVYREVCASCHGMSLMSFRNLGQQGGPFFDPRYPNPNDSPYVRALASEVQVGDIDSETGDAIRRNATSADRFPSPYPNEAAARGANGGAYPPDLSTIVKSREGGPDYVYSILTGYQRPPAGLTVGPGQHYNPFLPGDLTASWRGNPRQVPQGGFIAMPPPLTSDGQVTYDDGTRATVRQMAEDVTAYLTWASEPHAVQRRQTGLAVMVYLIIFAGIVYLSYKRIWRNVAH